jgi:DedD protein
VVRPTATPSPPPPKESAVVAEPPAPQPAVRSKAPEPPPVTGWSVQLGSFVSRDNAQRLVRELKGQGFNAFIAEGGSKRGKLYRVRVGPAADRAAVTALATKLRAAGQPGSVVPYP